MTLLSLNQESLIPNSPPTSENRFTNVRLSVRVGGLIGANFIERNDITDANTEFTGYCRLHSGTNAPDGGQGILISIFNRFMYRTILFFLLAEAFYVRLNGIHGENGHMLPLLKDDLFCHF